MAKGITLIGMPGVGKSTVGRLLADRLSFNFVDLDNLIRDREGKTHAQIQKEFGDAELTRLEEFHTLNLQFEKTVFAPGGSIIYSPKAMEKLCRETRVIYLSAPLATIKRNLGDGIYQRGIVGLATKGLEGVLAERKPFYEKYAHEIVECGSARSQEIAERLAALPIS